MWVFKKKEGIYKISPKVPLKHDARMELKVPCALKL
jgi:hypothetical protein